MKNILIIDNYDSFSFNLLQLFEEAGAKVTIRKPNEGENMDLKGFEGIVLSPGPGIPTEDRCMLPIIERAVGKIPLLGVCFGYLALGLYFGAVLKKIMPVVHGQRATIRQTRHSDPLFNNLPRPFEAGLYHSWVLDSEQLPPELLPTAVSEDGRLMAFRHRSIDVAGIQFHPESYMTKEGAMIAKNWLVRVVPR